MAFEKELPKWENQGVEPPESKKATGWEAGEKPPADYFNWQWNRTYEALKELQEKAAEKVDVQQAQQTADDAATAAANAQQTADDAQSDIDAHKEDKNNPHNVTSSQVNLLPLNSFNFDDPGTLYPGGVTAFSTTEANPGWPATAGMVTTFKDLRNDLRTVQIIFDAGGGSVPPNLWIRNHRIDISGTGWSNLAEILHTGNTTNIVNQEYEKGGWTPELRFGGSTSGISYTFRAGQYTRIANVVYWSFSIALNSKGSASGSAVIAGLPFVREPVLGYAHCIGSASNIAVPSGRWLVSRISSTASIYLETNDGVSTTALTNAEFANNSLLHASGFYFI